MRFVSATRAIVFKLSIVLRANGAHNLPPAQSQRGDIVLSFRPTRAVWPPEPGFFAFKLVKGAWSVPARIWHTECGWQAEVDGTLHAPHIEPEHAYMVAAIWHAGTMIDPATYEWLGAVREHARLNDPDHPSLHPRRKISMMTLRPLHPPRSAFHP